LSTGIIEEVGRVRSAERGTLVVESSAIIGDAALGDSIAVNGVDLTIAEMDGGSMTFNCMPETYRRSNLGELAAGDPVNLERSATPTTRLSGHIVRGVVEATGKLMSLTPEEDAVLARKALRDAAAQTGAFRIVGAEEMLRDGADPEAWFGLEATLGYQFGVAASGPLLHAAAPRAGAGYFPHHVVMAPGFVAFGAGVRPGVRIPRMREIDVGPTVAALLGLSLEDAAAEKGKLPDGRPLVGALDFVERVPAGR